MLRVNRGQGPLLHESSALVGTALLWERALRAIAAKGRSYCGTTFVAGLE
jgi:hypothetical protein